MEFNFARCRLGDAAQDLEQGTLACAVATYDADNLSWLDLKRDILERPYGVRIIILDPGKAPEVPEITYRGSEGICNGLAEGTVYPFLGTKMILLG